MLTSLHISNIVLIEKLNLEFGRGLNVLTGETGAGKSILLDALSLALGARSDIGLIRHGCENAQVVAEFDIINNDLKSILIENGIEFDGTLILRRMLSQDGKSRAWVNDIPVSIKILNQIGNALVEIHGQFENHSLLDQTTHRKTLDEFGIGSNSKYTEILNNVKVAYTELHSAEKKLKELEALVEKSETEREFLEHNIAELSALNPQIGEEEDLANRRAIMMNAEKNAGILSDAITILNSKGKSLDSLVFDIAHTLERIKTDPNPYQKQIDKLYEIADNISEISDQLLPQDTDQESIENIEERLFAIRAAVRKHRVSADDLSVKLIQMTEQLNQIDNSDIELKKLKQEVKNKKSEFIEVSSKLTIERIYASDNLRKQILREFPDLKLGQADFMVERKENAPNASGTDEIVFMIKTNPGNPFAPLHKIASGGELARLMLALRVVLQDKTHPRTFIFDEVDTGISGATASSVGERLARLADEGQALVVTHSAQVAGFADKHFKIEKIIDNNSTLTVVTEVIGDARINEIARIISGSKITSESIASAKILTKDLY
ncbi:MAG: DNA repair protein RecN [Alphaproteobacteria bacterium]|nr:DNA repair protein RecN [Alphaproteobacteria bacterium]MBN2675223.1 DNA repair protein RecN [Alphaproteobacteria bacterium]